MKLITRSLALLVGINLIFAGAAFANFAMQQTRQVPISRLLRNLEYERKEVVNQTDKAMIDFRIGRLHAMAYAQGVEQGPTLASAAKGSKYELPAFGEVPDHAQYTVSNKNAKSAAAQEHLKSAITHLQVAAKTDPSLIAAKLGLGWCLQQAGDKTKALALYREVFAHAFEGERKSQGGMAGWSVALEAGTYLKPMLDPVKDKRELQDIQAKETQLQKLPRYVTPIVIPLTSACALKDLVANKRVRYDLDGFGARWYSKWLTPRAAWLVFDSDHGAIDSGLKLVGQSSFWIFWQNGYEVLRGLDDNHDGKLSGKELAGMALWRDLNSNGVSERGEVRPLSAYGIVELKVECQKNPDGVLFSKSGVTLKNGSIIPSYDIVLPTSCLSSDASKSSRHLVPPSAVFPVP